MDAKLLAEILFWVGSAILVNNFFIYAQFLPRKIPNLFLSLVFLLVCFLQGAFSYLYNFVPPGASTQVLLPLSMLNGYLMNFIMAHLLLRTIGFYDEKSLRIQRTLYIFPVVAGLLMLLSPWRGLFLTQTQTGETQVGVLGVVGSTLSGVVLSAVMLLSFVYTLRHKARHVSMRVNWLIMAALLVPTLAGWLELTIQQNGVDAFRFSSYLACIPGMVVCYVNFGYLRTARSNAIANTQEIYVLFDRWGHMVDVNPPGEKFFAQLCGDVPPSQSQFFEAVGVSPAVQGSSFEFAVGTPGTRRYYQGMSFQLGDSISRYCGDGYIIQEITEYRQKVDYLNTLAEEDALTGIKNRRYFFDYSDQLMRKGWDGPFLLTMLMMDLDWFKNINDTYGHPVGDEILIAVCRVCEQSIRRADVLFRYGGEELAVLSVGTDPLDGIQMAQRIVEAVASTPFSTSAGPIPVTISVGGCSFVVQPGDSIDRWIEEADRCLYQAKADGRNRAIFS